MEEGTRRGGADQSCTIVREMLEYLTSFEYTGGGYYRKKGVPRGESADMLHGSEIQQLLQEALSKANESKTGEQS